MTAPRSTSCLMWIHSEQQEEVWSLSTCRRTETLLGGRQGSECRPERGTGFHSLLLFQQLHSARTAQLKCSQSSRKWSWALLGWPCRVDLHRQPGENRNHGVHTHVSEPSFICKSGSYHSRTSCITLVISVLWLKAGQWQLTQVGGTNSQLINMVSKMDCERIIHHVDLFHSCLSVESDSHARDRDSHPWCCVLQSAEELSSLSAWLLSPQPLTYLDTLGFFKFL